MKAQAARTDGQAIPRPREPRVIERQTPRTFAPSRTSRQLKAKCRRCGADPSRWCLKGRQGSTFGLVHPERGDTPTESDTPTDA